MTNSAFLPEDLQDPLASRRLFMPPPRAPRRVAIYHDLLTALGLHVHAWRLALEHMAVPDGGQLLQVGCGTGDLALEVKRSHPSLEVEGVDPDESAIEVAARHAEGAGLHVLFKKGYPQDLPETAESQDAVLCVLFLHRLRGEDRGDAFMEIRRVLRPGGRFLLVDFGAPAGGLSGWLVRRLALHEPGVEDHLKMGLLELLKIGGFEDVKLLGAGKVGLQAVSGRKKA